MQDVERVIPQHRYVPDLRGFMDDCEANYVRFMHLLPSIHLESEWAFALQSVEAPPSLVRLQVIERSRYTCTLTMIQEFDFPPWLPQPRLTVRVYHDARMAEVLSCQDSPKLRQRYDFPNGKMYHPDEKAQANTLLGEWLLACLASACSLNVSQIREL